MSVGADIAAILALGELDRDLIRTRRRLERAAHIAAPQRERVAVAQAELEQLSSASKRSKLEVGRLEAEAQQKQQEIDKAQVALNQAKSNEEYQGHLKVIGNRKAELSELETQILMAYDAQEERDTRAAAGKKRLDEQQRELKAAEARVAEEEARISQELAELEARRAEAAGGVEPAHRELYERILAKLSDSAIAEIVDEHCQGCFVKARPNQISLVRGGQELVTCTSCGRILYGRFD